MRRKINATKWILLRKNLRVFENVLHASSMCFSFVGLVFVIYLFNRLRVQEFQGMSRFEIDLFLVILGVSSLMLVHTVAIAYFKTRRGRLETELYPAGFLPLHDADSFHQVLKKEVKRAGRYHLPLALCIVKLDGFKAMCDAQGWAHGKKIFGGFVKLASGVVRSSDYLAHLASDEFAVLLCHSDTAQAQKFLYRLYIQTQERMEMTFSSGATAYRAGETGEVFFDRAQQALTQALAEGEKKNHCAIFPDDRAAVRNF